MMVCMDPDHQEVFCFLLVALFMGDGTENYETINNGELRYSIVPTGRHLLMNSL